MKKKKTRLDITAWDYFNPRYWPILLGLVFLRLLGKLPLSWTRALGKRLGRFLMIFAKRRRHIASVNLKLCFPQLSAEQHQKLLTEVFEDTGMALLEIGWAWYADMQKYGDVDIIGLENLSQARAQNKGVILISFHQTTLELGGAYFGRDQDDIVAVYKPDRNPFFDRAMFNGRNRNCLPVAKSNLRVTLKNLKAKKVIWYAADQDYGRAQSVFVPFFGIPAATVTATSWFVKQTGAIVIPMTHRRTQAGIQVEIHPALENFATIDDTTDAAQIMGFLEQYLKKYPANYLWVHRRFKTRPEGEPTFYN